MKLTTLLTPLTLITLASADAAAIADSLRAVNTATLELQSTVAKWKGTLLTSLPIIKESAELLIATKKGTKAAKSTDKTLEFLEVLGVAELTINLATSVNATMTTLIQAKPKFDRLKMGPLILVNLGIQKKATEEMSTAIAEKVPEELRELAGELVKPIEDAFEIAIDAFHPF